jgi:hypothetical protein
MKTPGSDRIKQKLDWSYWPSSPVPHRLPDTDALLERSCHPELEDHSAIAWGLEQCKQSKEHTSTIDVLEVQGQSVKWRSGIDDDELASISSVSLHLHEF